MLARRLQQRGQIDRARGHDRRDRMLVDQLRLAVAAQQHREIVEPGDDPLQLDALDQEHRDRDLGSAQRIQEQVLKRSLLVGHSDGLLLLAGSAPHRAGSRRRTSPRSATLSQFSCSEGRRPYPSFLATVGDAQQLELAVQRRALHADEAGGARDIAREAADLDAEIFALERLARFACSGAPMIALAPIALPASPGRPSTSGGSRSRSIRPIRSPGARITVRSTTLRSWRTLPGQS